MPTLPPSIDRRTAIQFIFLAHTMLSFLTNPSVKSRINQLTDEIRNLTLENTEADSWSEPGMTVNNGKTVFDLFAKKAFRTVLG